MSTFSNSFRAETFDRNVMSFFLRRNAEISGNFPGNLLAGCGNSFRKLSSSTPEILTYPNPWDGSTVPRAAAQLPPLGQVAMETEVSSPSRPASEISEPRPWTGPGGGGQPRTSRSEEAACPARGRGRRARCTRHDLASGRLGSVVV